MIKEIAVGIGVFIVMLYVGYIVGINMEKVQDEDITKIGAPIVVPYLEILIALIFSFIVGVLLAIYYTPKDSNRSMK